MFLSEFQITFQAINNGRKIAYDDNQMYLLDHREVQNSLPINQNVCLVKKKNYQHKWREKEEKKWFDSVMLWKNIWK